MTRGKRVGGASAAALWVAAAVILAVVWPGNGASAHEDGDGCDHPGAVGSAATHPVPPRSSEHRESPEESRHRSHRPTCVPTDTSPPTSPSAISPSETPSWTTSGEPTPTATATVTEPGTEPATPPGASPTTSESPTPTPTWSEPAGRPPVGNSGGPPGHPAPPPSGSATPPAETTSAAPPASSEAAPTPPAVSTPSTPNPASGTPSPTSVPAASAGPSAPSTGPASVIPPLDSLPATAFGNVVSHVASASNQPMGSTTTPATATPGAGGAGTRPPSGDIQTPAGSGSKQGTTPVDLAAKSAVGTRDSLLLGALVVGFTFAVGAVVVAAGLRGGRRVH
jgi:hypothetical protein